MRKLFKVTFHYYVGSINGDGKKCVGPAILGDDVVEGAHDLHQAVRAIKTRLECELTEFWGERQMLWVDDIKVLEFMAETPST